MKLPTHSLPKYVIDTISEKFTESEVNVLDRNWHFFSQMRFGSASKRDFWKEGRMILSCLKLEEFK